MTARILVVDDVEPNVRLLEAKLTLEYYEVLTATDGATALEIAAAERLILPGVRDIRGYQAMYRDFVAGIRTGRPPEMCLERAMEDQRLMDQIMASAREGA